MYPLLSGLPFVPLRARSCAQERGRQIFFFFKTAHSFTRGNASGSMSALISLPRYFFCFGCRKAVIINCTFGLAPVGGTG